MTKDKISEIIKSAVKEYFESQDFKDDVTNETALMGEKSRLDSIGLVNVVVDIEGRLIDEGVDVTIMSEKAMSMRNSPFLSVETLAEFVNNEIESENE